MKSHTRHIIVTSAVLGAIAVTAGVFAWTGIYNIGADDAHTKPVYSMLQMARERSITARSRKLHPSPDLNDAARIRQGAGNYNAMCTGCHLAPGMAETELSKGLYPAPPNLSTADMQDPAHHFWVIKHGIKASGMPAWGKSMSDDYIWNMVAFLQQLPKLNEEQYKAMVASSGGHSHGGGETAPHDDGDGHHDGEMEGMHMDESKPHSHPAGTPAHDDSAGDHPDTPMDTKPIDESKPHSHPPGTPAHNDSAPAPSASSDSKPAEDGHHHEH
ncbi:MAG: cytochrome c [Thermomonas sp.]